MKKYNKILEAINKGILLALDDFEDNEHILNIKSKLVLNRDYTKEYLDLMKEVVDLDLPSGTLWCKYNLGVDPNKLLTSKDWYGDYYAWGETEANKRNNNKIYFDWDNYKFGQEEFDTEITKYNKHDNLTLLELEDDAAYLNKKFYNFKFHIPTKELCEELINYTQNYWVKNYNPNNIEHHTNDDGIKGLNGRVFVGKNRNQLFIPAAGHRREFYFNDRGKCCNTWSSTLDLNNDNIDDAYTLETLNADSYDIFVVALYRYIGMPIRPVINLYKLI